MRQQSGTSRKSSYQYDPKLQECKNGEMNDDSNVTINVGGKKITQQHRSKSKDEARNKNKTKTKSSSKSKIKTKIRKHSGDHGNNSNDSDVNNVGDSKDVRSKLASKIKKIMNNQLNADKVCVF